MTDSSDTTILPRRRRRARILDRHDDGTTARNLNAGDDSESLDAELLALDKRIQIFVEEWDASLKAAPFVDAAVSRARDALPGLVGDKDTERLIRAEKEAQDTTGVRHTDDISNDMFAPSLEIMGLPAFTEAGLRAKALLAKFVTGQVRLHFFPQTTVQNFLDSGI